MRECECWCVCVILFMVNPSECANQIETKKEPQNENKGGREIEVSLPSVDCGFVASAAG